MSKKSRKKLRGWDTYVQEAERPSLELPLPDGDTFVLKYPTKESIDILDRQREAGDKPASDDDFAIALLGEAEGCRLLALAAKAPVGTLQLMLGDAMVEWGLWKENPFRREDSDLGEEMGNSPSSST
jgi:hypothetical protein